MAQVVRYYQDNVVFTEGPFVIVNAGGWRIEAELKGHKCPALPSNSIYEIMKKSFGFYGKTDDKEQAARVCDALNHMVAVGQIVLADNGWWVDVESVRRAKERAEQVLREVQ